jgi:GNAT superfamily N-acetyltransferase
MLIRPIAATSDDARALFPLFRQLRPHLVDEHAFLERVARQEAQGYSMLAVEADGAFVAAAGFREAEFLAWGRVLYIDDLVTDPDRLGEGHAGAALDWLIAHARARGCNAVHLDTGYQRHAAHRVYLRKGFELDCHHMKLALDQ